MLRSSVRCLVTVIGTFSASSRKVIAQAAAVSHQYYFRKTMHYQTEQRGHQNSPDYRLYFSKLISAIVKGTMPVFCIECCSWLAQSQRLVSDRVVVTLSRHAGQGKRLTFELCFLPKRLFYGFAFSAKIPLTLAVVVTCFESTLKEKRGRGACSHVFVGCTSCLLATWMPVMQNLKQNQKWRHFYHQDTSYQVKPCCRS